MKKKNGSGLLVCLGVICVIMVMAIASAVAGGYRHLPPVYLTYTGSAVYTNGDRAVGISAIGVDMTTASSMVVRVVNDAAGTYTNLVCSNATGLATFTYEGRSAITLWKGGKLRFDSAWTGNVSDIVIFPTDLQ